MSEKKIEVGSVVMLKSGGMPMTVVAINADKKMVCHWFEESDGTCNRQMAAYDEVCLKLFKEGQ